MVLDARFAIGRSTSLDPPPMKNPIFRIDFGTSQFPDDVTEEDEEPPAVMFPSMRLLLAALLCCCFIALSVSTSNMAVALICMTSCPIHGYGGDLDWTADQEGLVLAAQNAGSLLMIVTGLWADRLNGKFMVCLSLLLVIAGNAMLPLLAHKSFWYAVIARLLIGASDACLMPATNSLITRWFPQAERAAAIGLITGGRQIGTLFILPAAGYLCTRRDILDGWPAIFYLSCAISVLIALFWIPIGADKPGKQCCISQRERMYIESRIACESIGKRTDRTRRIPYSSMLRSRPLWVAVIALVCHEYPLVIMLQFLPNYMRDVLGFAPTRNGVMSTLPIACLFISKTLSSSLSSYLTTKRDMDKTFVCKMFNGLASAGLSISILAVPLFNRDEAYFAVASLCLAMLFAGMHTPGVQTSLVQLAPPFSGVITGWSFFMVAWFGIGNKILTKAIVQHGSPSEWALVFRVASVVAALPVVLFSLYGSAEREHWAAPSSKSSVYSFSIEKRKTSNASHRSNKSSMTTITNP